MVLEGGKVMVRTSAALLALAVVLTLVGTATAQDRKWTFLRSFIETNEFPVKHFFGGKEIKVDVYLSDIKRLTNEMIEVEVLQDLEIPAQSDDGPPFHSKGQVITINCKNLHWKTTDHVSYEFPMGQRGFDRWTDKEHLRKRLVRDRWFPGDAADFLSKIKGSKEDRLLSDDIKRLCRK